MSSLLKRNPFARLVGLEKTGDGFSELPIDPERHYGANENLNEGLQGYLMGAAAHSLLDGRSRAISQLTLFKGAAREGAAVAKAKLVLRLWGFTLLRVKLYVDEKLIATAYILRKRLPNH